MTEPRQFISTNYGRAREELPQLDATRHVLAAAPTLMTRTEMAVAQIATQASETAPKLAPS